jgi:hypothetical protein
MSCSKCRDSGILEQDGKLYECICSYIRRRAAEMPPYIKKAQVIPPHLQLQIIKLYDKSLYVISSWNDIKAVIKIMMLKYATKFIKITSDREIRDVYVGAASRSARGISSNDDENFEVYNSLQDLMDIPDLMIVRLNEMHYKNKAAPGALEEALSYRLDRDKPVWVISNIDKPFVEGSHAWSGSVFELLSTAFQKATIPRILPKVIVNDSGLSPDNISPSPRTCFHEMAAISPTASQPVSKGSVFNPAESPSMSDKGQEDTKEAPKKPFRKIQSTPDSDANVNPLSMYGSGVNKPKRFGNRD